MRAILFLLVAAACAAATNDVLIVADEFPAMQALAKKLDAGAKAHCQIVPQTEIPAETGRYSAVIVYIHRTIGEPAEKVFIDYARAGGKLILLHHSISSGKRRNPFWLPSFLEMSLPEKPYSEGGYKYYEGITMELVNLAPKHYITTHDVRYPGRTEYRGSKLPSVELEDTEVYLNHVFSGERTTLLGVKFFDKVTGKLFEQDTGGWIKKTGKGAVVYFMAGHSVSEFENPAYAQMIVNAVNFKPR